MTFTLEALQAKHGDSLLLHYGDPTSPRLIVIDGGPSRVYTPTLRPRLEAIRQTLPPDSALPIRMLMVSHIDDDHINGVLDLTEELLEKHENHEPLPYQIQTLWHNSFDDVVGANSAELLSSGQAEVGAASLEEVTASFGQLSAEAAAIVASVRQGRRLRDDATVLGLAVNQPGGGLITARGDANDSVDLGDGLEFLILGPRQKQVEALQEKWDRELRRLGLDEVRAGNAGAAEMIDKSAYNLASLVVLARADGKTMLLTGDARGDHLLASVRDADLLTNGKLHVNLLKMPHHGSDRNVDTDFFRTITADHYVISGDGKYGNPEVATFEMIFTARGNDRFTLHLTYPVTNLGHGFPKQDLQRLLDREQQAGKPFEVRAPGPEEKSISVAL
ncbi:MAG: hypothetical protein ACC742_04210 [Thermoanaerobaculales bacterium]